MLKYVSNPMTSPEVINCVYSERTAVKGLKKHCIHFHRNQSTDSICNLVYMKFSSLGDFV